MDTRTLAYLAAAIFGAGVAWGALRGRIARQAKDQNGIGKKLNEHMAEVARDRERARMAILLIAPEGKREELLRQWLGESWK